MLQRALSFSTNEKITQKKGPKSLPPRTQHVARAPQSHETHTIGLAAPESPKGYALRVLCLRVL